jgi:hypothetical protein
MMLLKLILRQYGTNRPMQDPLEIVQKRFSVTVEPEEADTTFIKVV